MAIRSIKDMQLQCKLIINWKKEGLFPVELFGLPEQHTQDDINKAYRKLAVLFHPDKNPKFKEDAETAFKLIAAAKEYLIYRCTGEAGRIDRNPFFEVLNSPLLEDASYEDMAYGDLLGIFSQGVCNDDLIGELKKRIERKNLLLKYTHALSGSVLHFAVRFNTCEFFRWLLQAGADPLLKAGGLTSVDAVLLRCKAVCFQLLDVLAQEKGEEWLNQVLESTFLNSDSPDILSSTLAYRNLLFPPKSRDALLKLSVKNPFLIIALQQCGYLTKEEENQLIRMRIIGHPLLYLKLDEKQRADPYLLIAALAQLDDPSKLVAAIPIKSLPIHFLYALLKMYPVLEQGEMFYLRNTAKYYYFHNPKVLAVNASVCVFDIAAIVFSTVLPVAVLFPPATPLSLAVMGIGLALMLCVTIYGFYEQLKTNQEKRHINRILKENSFFKPPPVVADPSNPLEAEEHNDSQLSSRSDFQVPLLGSSLT